MNIMMDLIQSLLPSILNAILTGFGVAIGTYFANKTLIKSMEKGINNLNKVRNNRSK